MVERGVLSLQSEDPTTQVGSEKPNEKSIMFASWGPLGKTPGAPLRRLEQSWCRVGRIGAIFRRRGAVLEASWGPLGAVLGALGEGGRDTCRPIAVVAQDLGAFVGLV